MAFFDEVNRRFKAGSMLTRIIYINIAVFVVLRIVGVFFFLFGVDSSLVLNWLTVHSDLSVQKYLPWTVITYAFTHYSLLHILFNMLWLYWMGRIFMDYFNAKQFTALYVLGALGGVALYLVAMNVLPAFSDIKGDIMLGASASVLAITVAMGVYAPIYKMNLLFLGSISLKWMVLVTVVLDFMSLDGGNAGGHVAHLGGACVGVLFALMMKRGHDITSPLNAIVDWVVSLFKRRKKPSVGGPVGGKAYTQTGTAQQRTTAQSSSSSTAGTSRTGSTNASRTASEKELDEVLAKLKRSGYGALTEEERNLLFNFSRKR